LPGKNEAVIETIPILRLASTPPAKTMEAARTFLAWVASEEFAQDMPPLPGFFPLANVSYTLSDPVAQELQLAQRGGSFFPLLSTKSCR